MNNYYFTGKGCSLSYILHLELELGLDSNQAFINMNKQTFKGSYPFHPETSFFLVEILGVTLGKEASLILFSRSFLQSVKSFSYSQQLGTISSLMSFLEP